VVYGHTHKPDVRKNNGVLVVNPGETGGWLTGKSTVALLDPVSLEAEITFL
jgi:predicted phosphodiesterase